MRRKMRTKGTVMKKRIKKREKMETIVIDKEFLEGYKTLLVGLENCDVYEIKVADILDIYCKATLMNEKKNEYQTDDGFIKISVKASKTVESSILKSNVKEPLWDYRLKERLEMCGGVADMTSFSLKDKRNHKMYIYVPYDPLVDLMHGNEIELSNCPSLEIDDEGNMIIAFGKSSKQPKRKDNNYHELVVGWEDAFGAYSPNVLEVKAKILSTFWSENMNFSFFFEICDKNCKKDVAELVFMDCKDVTTEIFFPERGDCEIVMSKMKNGRIYVGFYGLGLDFICNSVIEYNYYCNRKTNGGKKL